MPNQFYSALQWVEIKTTHFWFTEDKDSETEIFTKKYTPKSAIHISTEYETQTKTKCSFWRQ